VDTICVGSTPYYIPWYEFYPAGTVTISCSVHANDTLTSHVYVSGDTVTTALTDSSRGCNGGSGTWTRYGSTSASGLALSSAEWIVEKNIHLLTDFGTVTWTSASATDTSGHTDGINNGPWSWTDIVAVDHNGAHATVCAAPGDVSRSHTSFTDYFDGCS
jgi:Peptidase A4 family